MRILTCGAEALLIEVADLSEAEGLYAQLRRDTPRGVTELVPAARTVLILFDRDLTDASRLRAQLRISSARRPAGGAPSPPPAAGPSGRDASAADGIDSRGTEAVGGAAPTDEPESTPSVTVSVRYDGPDLEEVARLTGLAPAQIVERHTRGSHHVAFCGFAPGFAYIAGLDAGLRVPRRATPRTRVPAGAVAIADGFTGVYPRASPGGWHLIGHTDLVVFDLGRDPPALLAPGVRVRFVAVGSAREPM
jgi:allophanate hydrolase subunit 1